IDLVGEVGPHELACQVADIRESRAIQKTNALTAQRPGPASKDVPGLPADRQERGVFRASPHELERAPHDVRIEGATQPLVGGQDADELPSPFAAGEQRMLVFPQSADERPDQIGHPKGVRSGLENPLLGAPELRRGDELHGAGNLLRGLDGADPPTNVLKGRHRTRSRLAYAAAVTPWAATNSAFAPVISSSSWDRRASESSFFSRISARSAPPRLSAYWWSIASNPRSASTGTSS